ncbi:MAG: hypothetical protein A2Y15_01695 [Clostridiales bacterium GWF2_36_10]|nr:MAG: hypothetical protein A2Y15_01695 [Clostridiales bacterium GWF2_36_10]
MRIKINPVLHYKSPAYPDMSEADSNSDLLKRLPNRWKQNQAVLTAITAITAMSFSSHSITQNYDSQSVFAPISTSSSTVAPIFEHGEGIGSIGGYQSIYPTFITEQEAMSIIKNEAFAAGINLVDIPEGYSVDPHDYDGYRDDKNKYILGTQVSLEASDNIKGIAVSFISSNEAMAQSKNDEFYSLVVNINTKQRAKDAASDWEEEDVPYAVGTFYDSTINYERYKEIEKELFGDSYDYSQSNATQLQEAINDAIEEDLRAQVRDFIEWLRGQGII